MKDWNLPEKDYHNAFMNQVSQMLERPIEMRKTPDKEHLNEDNEITIREYTISIPGDMPALNTRNLLKDAALEKEKADPNSYIIDGIISENANIKFTLPVGNRNHEKFLNLVAENKLELLKTIHGESMGQRISDAKDLLDTLNQYVTIKPETFDLSYTALTFEVSNQKNPLFGADQVADKLTTDLKNTLTALGKKGYGDMVKNVYGENTISQRKPKTYAANFPNKQNTFIQIHPVALEELIEADTLKMGQKDGIKRLQKTSELENLLNLMPPLEHKEAKRLNAPRSNDEGRSL